MQALNNKHITCTTRNNYSCNNKRWKNEIESEWLDITFHPLHGSSRQRIRDSIRFDNSWISGFYSHDVDDDDGMMIGIGIKLENDAKDWKFW